MCPFPDGQSTLSGKGVKVRQMLLADTCEGGWISANLVAGQDADRLFAQRHFLDGLGLGVVLGFHICCSFLTLLCLLVRTCTTFLVLSVLVLV